MKSLFPCWLLVASLAGCGPVSLYYKPGVSVVRWQSETTNCEVQALRDAPVANQIQQAPPVFVPSKRICDSSGACTTRPGYWRSGQIYTIDVNSGLRARVQTQCMAKQGYQPVDINRCSAGTKVSGPTRVLPRLSEKSCVVVLDEGQFAIVTAQ